MISHTTMNQIKLILFYYKINFDFCISFLFHLSKIFNGKKRIENFIYETQSLLDDEHLSFVIIKLHIKIMIQSLVDYVLERGRIDYGEFAPKDSLDPSTALYNHRKLLAYLFEEEGSSEKYPEKHSDSPSKSQQDEFPTLKLSKYQGSSTISLKKSMHN